VALPPSTIVSVGAGTSNLVDHLISIGHRVIAVDLSPTALDRLSTRIGPNPNLRTRAGDVRTLSLDEPVDVWHDRAVFHFLTTPADQQAYADAASAIVRPGGHLVLAGFAPTGPAECSGLPVARHDPGSLAVAFAPTFALVESFEADHLTPWGSSQRFVHTLFRRRRELG
jgi:SAM-dependent methyltransferase